MRPEAANVARAEGVKHFGEVYVYDEIDRAAANARGMVRTTTAGWIDINKSSCSNLKAGFPTQITRATMVALFL